MGLLCSSSTTVPIGEFSSTKPSIAETKISGGFESTGFTVTINLAVVDRLTSDFSCA